MTPHSIFKHGVARMKKRGRKRDLLRIRTLPVPSPLLHVSTGRCASAHSSGSPSRYKASALSSTAHTTSTHHPYGQRNSFVMRVDDIYLLLSYNAPFSLLPKRASISWLPTSSSHHATTVSSHQHSTPHHHGLPPGHRHLQLLPLEILTCTKQRKRFNYLIAKSFFFFMLIVLKKVNQKCVYIGFFTGKQPPVLGALSVFSATMMT